jgi:hypothetical protein
MSAKVIQLQRLFRRSRDWSSQELAELYRVESALIQTGLSIDTERGLSPEGEPWFTFCRREDGEVVIHIARVEGIYILTGPVYEGIAYGRDITSLIRDMAVVATGFLQSTRRPAGTSAQISRTTSAGKGPPPDTQPRPARR